MSQDAFTAGVRPGGLTQGYEINILICYVLHHAGCPLSYSQLSRSTQHDELVNYFEFAQALDRLIQDKLLHTQHDDTLGEDLYHLDALGVEAVDTFGGHLPLAVRERAAARVKKILLLERREREILVDIQKTDDGYKMTVTMEDIGTDLLSVALFLPTKEACEQAKRRFMNEPELVYKGILALITGELAEVQDIFPTNLDLYD